MARSQSTRAPKAPSHPKKRRPARAGIDELQWLEQVRQSPAVFTKDEALALDQNVRADRDGVTRRMALVLLSQPGAKLLEEVASHREMALAVADTMRCLGAYLGRLRSLTDMLGKAELWMMLALCQREDMQEIMDEVKQDKSNVVPFPRGAQS